MGFRPNLKTWQTGAEGHVANAQERGMSFDDLVEKSRVQAEQYARNQAPQITTFIGAGHRDTILNSKNRENVAKSIARENPHFIPETMEDDLNLSAAFLIALAEELSKPEYKQ